MDVLEIGLCLPLGTEISPLTPRRELGEAVRDRGAMARRKLEERGDRSRTGEFDLPPKREGVKGRCGRLVWEESWDMADLEDSCDLIFHMVELDVGIAVGLFKLWIRNAYEVCVRKLRNL